MLSVTMAGLNAAQKSMDVASNNMANANTVGFKRSYANFGDVFSNDPASDPKTSVGSGVLTSSVSRDTTAGAVTTTGRVTDMAIDGRGFFVVRDPSASGDTFSYTRAGNFSMDSQGFLTDTGGNQLIGFSPVNSGKLDANGKPIMAPNTAAAKTAIQIVPQFNNGATLPDGSIAGQEIQQISLNGTASATGPVVIGGVSVSIANGDTVAVQANKIKSALTADASFANRTVTLVGSGDQTKVQIAFAPTEGAVDPLSVDTPTAVSPSISTTTAFQPASGIVHNLTFSNGSQLVPGDNYDFSVPIDLNGGNTTTIMFTATVPNPTSGFAAEVNSTLLAKANATPNVTASMIPTVVDAANGMDFEYASDTIAGTGADATHSVGITPTAPPSHTSITWNADVSASAVSTPKTETITLTPPMSDGIMDVAGIPVTVTAGMSAQSLANAVQTALTQAFPNRTISMPSQIGNSPNYAVTMNYLISEGDGALVQPKLANKKPTTGNTVETAKGSLDPVLMQGLSISSKGEVLTTYSNGSTYTSGFVAIASFANDGGLKDVGGNRFVQTGDSGTPSITAAGAPKAGNIMSGELEQANVDITTELMAMIKAQQVYNGNARVLQTTVDTVTKITDIR